jgi:hypothetical protein
MSRDPLAPKPASPLWEMTQDCGLPVRGGKEVRTTPPRWPAEEVPDRWIVGEGDSTRSCVAGDGSGRGEEKPGERRWRGASAGDGVEEIKRPEGETERAGVEEMEVVKMEVSGEKESSADGAAFAPGGRGEVKRRLEVEEGGDVSWTEAGVEAVREESISTAGFWDLASPSRMRTTGAEEASACTRTPVGPGTDSRSGWVAGGLIVSGILLGEVRRVMEEL